MLLFRCCFSELSLLPVAAVSAAVSVSISRHLLSCGFWLFARLLHRCPKLCTNTCSGRIAHWNTGTLHTGTLHTTHYTLHTGTLHTTHWNTTHWKTAHYTLVVVVHWHLVYRILVGHCYWGRLLASGYNSVTLLSHTASNTAQNSSHSARSLSQSCNRRMMKMFRVEEMMMTMMFSVDARI